MNFPFETAIDTVDNNSKKKHERVKLNFCLINFRISQFSF